jgi:hypothetical protein
MVEVADLVGKHLQTRRRKKIKIKREGEGRSRE